METRIRRPVLFLGYGERGHDWLRRTAERIRVDETLREMMDARVVQFWSVGAGPAPTGAEPVRWLDGGVGALGVKSHLAEAKAARSQARFHLDLRGPILIVERWSLFSGEWEPRESVRTAFERARYVDCDPSGARELEYQWISLVDAVRPASRPDRRAVTRLRRALRSEDIHDLALFIDRVTDADGVVDEDMADRCFHDIAVGLVTSDLAFPVPGSGDERRSGILTQDVDTGCLYPVAVVSLLHGEGKIEETVAARLEQGLLDGSARAGTVAVGVSLEALVVEDEEAIQAQVFSPMAARRKREQAAERLLADALLLRDVTEGFDQVARARRAVRQRLVDHAAAPAPHVAIGAVLAAIPGDSTVLIISAVVAVALVAAGVGVPLARRRRAGVTNVEPIHGRNEDVAQERSTAAAQWTQLLDGLESGLRAWRAVYEQPARVSRAEAWASSPQHPYEWHLQPEAVASAIESVPLRTSNCEHMARDVLRRVTSGEDAGKAIANALRAAARDLLLRDSAMAGETLAVAFKERADSLRTSIRSLPLMAKVGRPLRVEEVLWVIPRHSSLDAWLRDLEPVGLQSRMRILYGDLRSQSLRVAVGEPVGWSDVLSLSFLKS